MSFRDNGTGVAVASDSRSFYAVLKMRELLPTCLREEPGNGRNRRHLRLWLTVRNDPRAVLDFSNANLGDVRQILAEIAS